MLGPAGLLASLLSITGPPVDAQPDFSPRPSDPRASTFEPKHDSHFMAVSPQLRVSNHLVGMFRPTRPLAYGLDVEAGLDLVFYRLPVLLWVRPTTGYAFVHHPEFQSHASITGLGIGVESRRRHLIRYEPRFVAGTENTELMLGFRHGIEYHPVLKFVSLQVQHGVVWVGAEQVRHELRGGVSVEMVALFAYLSEHRSRVERRQARGWEV